MSAPATPRRSSRLAEKRWSSHFAKRNSYDKAYVVSTSYYYLGRFGTQFHEEKYPVRGVSDTFSMKCFYGNHIYQFLMNYPAFLYDHPSLLNVLRMKAESFLVDEKILHSKNIWAKKLAETLIDFLQMCDYIHLYKK
jgi:hypothetical protein